MEGCSSPSSILLHFGEESLRVEYLYKLFWIFLHRRLITSPHIFSVIFLYQYGLTDIHFILWVIIQHNFTNFVAQINHLWLVGALGGGTLRAWWSHISPWGRSTPQSASLGPPLPGWQGSGRVLRCVSPADQVGAGRAFTETREVAFLYKGWDLKGEPQVPWLQQPQFPGQNCTLTVGISL